MNKVLIDTDILIDHLRGQEKAKEYLKGIESGNVKGVISVITEAELAAGKSTRDMLIRMKVRRLVKILEKVVVTSEIAWKAGELKRDYNCRLMDALIAATALNLDLKLVTRNIKHYETITGLEIEEPY